MRNYKKILSILLSASLVFGTAFRTYADDLVSSSSAGTQEEMTVTIPETDTDVSAGTAEAEDTEPVKTEHMVSLKGDLDKVQVTLSNTRPSVKEEETDSSKVNACMEALSDEDLALVTIEQSNTDVLTDEEAEAVFQETEAADEPKEENDVFSLLEGTSCYVTVSPFDGYTFDNITVTTEGGQLIDVAKDDEADCYVFSMPDTDVTVNVAGSEIENTTQYSDSELDALSDYLEIQGLSVDETTLMLAATSTSTKVITFEMDGFCSYASESWGTGYDAIFTVHQANYQGNPYAYCITPEVQAPGHDSQGSMISYTTTVTDRTDAALVKVLYYGFGGPGDITGSYASTGPERHILTHMVATRVTKELGISGAGTYTYRANATAIAAADKLYAAIMAKPAVTGNVSILTPVSGEQTIMLLQSYIKPTTNGYAKLVKKSANPEITAGNPNYSLGGAGYVVYSDAALTNVAGTFTTNANGESSAVLTLAPATYYVKEVTVPKGFKLDNTVYKATVTAGNTTTISVSDYAKVKTGPMTLLQKVDAETGAATDELKGAQYTVKYYPVASAGSLGDPTATWVFATDQDGTIRLADSYKVSGDDLFKGSDGVPYLPLGVITIQETGAPEGYEIQDTVYTCTVTPDGEEWSELPTGDNAVAEQPVRTDLSVTKTVSGTGGNKAEEFQFTLKLTSPSDSIPLPETLDYTVSEAGRDIEKGSVTRTGTDTYAFTLSHGETITFHDIRYGTGYAVSEQNAEEEGYTVTSENAEGTILDKQVDAAFHNEKNMTVPTDADTNAPVLGGIAGAGLLILVLMQIRRKKAATTK